jgi:NADPH:quinone reductase-like Zn-dependent oxidoreductase
VGTSTTTAGKSAMIRQVVITDFGGPDKLRIVDTQPPTVGPNDVLVRVRAAGINPLELRIFARGPQAAIYGVQPPCGNGVDFAGVVKATGNAVTGLRRGDKVFGGVRMFAQADEIVVRPEEALPIPDGLPFETAACLFTSGRAALGSVASQEIGPNDLVLVSGASGPVGSLAVQLVRERGAQVFAVTRAVDVDFIRSVGAVPIVGGNDLTADIRRALPSPLTAVLDYQGKEVIDAALDLGVPPHRINTIAAKTHRPNEGIGTTHVGSVDNNALLDLARAIASGRISFRVARVRPLDEIVSAYEELAAGGVRGKIVLSF